MSSLWLGITEYILKRIYHNFPTSLFRLISSLNSVEYEIGFRLEGFFFSVFFFIIHLLPKLNRLHLRPYGRWSSLFFRKVLNWWIMCQQYEYHHPTWVQGGEHGQILLRACTMDISDSEPDKSGSLPESSCTNPTPDNFVSHTII